MIHTGRAQRHHIDHFVRTSNSLRHEPVREVGRACSPAIGSPHRDKGQWLLLRHRIAKQANDLHDHDSHDRTA